jgi:hypothetical protein
MLNRIQVISAVLGLALVVGVSAPPASAQSSYYDPQTAAPVAAPPAPAQDDNYAPPAAVTQAVPDGEQLPPPNVGYVPAPYYAGLPGCPVVGYYHLRDVLSGMYGVDALRRPLNEFGFPVDIYGRCLTYAPVTAVYNFQPMPVYVGWLGFHYGYRWYPGIVSVRLWGGPGVMVYRSYGAIPYGHTVVINHGYRPSGGVINNTTINRTTITGPSTTVRPGAGVTAPTTVRPGAGVTAPSTVRPGAGVTPPAATAPTSVTPPRAAPTAPSTFNRPGSGVTAPTSVTPPRAAPSAPSTFNRPSTPSYSAPSRPSTPSFSRPSGGFGGGGSFRPSGGGGGRRR